MNRGKKIVMVKLIIPKKIKKRKTPDTATTKAQCAW
jgi:hypothetical protein